MSPQPTSPGDICRRQRVSRMSGSLAQSIPAPPVDQSPVPPRRRNCASGGLRNCVLGVEVERKAAQSRRGSLTFAGSVGSLKRAGVSRRASTSASGSVSDLGDSMSSLNISSTDLNVSCSELGIYFSNIQYDDQSGTRNPKPRNRKRSVY